MLLDKQIMVQVESTISLLPISFPSNYVFKGISVTDEERETPPLPQFLSCSQENGSSKRQTHVVEMR